MTTPSTPSSDSAPPTKHSPGKHPEARRHHFIASPELSGLREVETRKKGAEAKIRELELARMRGEYVPIEPVIAVARALGIAIRRRGDSFPDRAAPHLVGETSIPVIREKLRGLVREWIEEFQTIVDSLREQGIEVDLSAEPEPAPAAPREKRRKLETKPRAVK
jgi:hypothetical protein